MYIGLLNNIKSLTFTHKGTDVSFPPSSTENGLGSWSWRYAYDNAIDVNYTLEYQSYIGAVCVDVTENSVTRVEILVDGAIAGCYTAETGKRTGGRLDIPVGKAGEGVTVRFYTDLRDLTLNEIELLGAHEDGNPLIWPTPKSVEFLDGAVRIKDVVSKNGDPDELYAAQF